MTIPYLRKSPTTIAVTFLITVLTIYGCKGTLGIWKKDRHPDVLYSFDTEKKAVALTIDDGPDPVSTRLILDTLAENESTATFFIITNHIPGNEALLEEMVSTGHELGNHLNRDEPSIDLDPPDFESELIRSHALLSEFSGTDWFRPGSGRYDDWMIEILAKHAYHCVLGSIYPLDAQITSLWFAKKIILWKVKPGAIIILHDAGSRGVRTARILADVLPKLRKKGYRIVNLTELQSIANTNQ
jgi:peptidoglycan/xylan/chitin deacetylase (PgdA/CDA1 family)